MTIGGNVSQDDVLLLTKNLAVMLKSGVSIVEALEITSSQSTKKSFVAMTTAIRNAVASGKKLSEGMEPFKKIFGILYITIITIGEKSGTLENSLLFLSQQLKRSFAFKRKVTTALIYPGIVIVTALIIGILISYFVLPRLTELFKSLDIEKLPLATSILLWIGDTMKLYGIFIVAGIIAGSIALWTFLHLKRVLPYWHALQFAFPVYGKLNQNLELSLLFRNLGIMLKSGVPLESSLSTLAEGTSNTIFKSYLTRMHEGVNSGKSLNSLITVQTFQYIPLAAIKVIGVGEKTGNLDESCLYLAQYYEEETENMLEVLSEVLEPAILLIVGILVAFLALAIISPIYQFTGSIRQ